MGNKLRDRALKDKPPRKKRPQEIENEQKEGKNQTGVIS